MMRHPTEHYQDREAQATANWITGIAAVLLLCVLAGSCVMLSGCVCYSHRDDFRGIDRKFPPGPLYQLFCGERP